MVELYQNSIGQQKDYAEKEKYDEAPGGYEYELT